MSTPNKLQHYWEKHPYRVIFTVLPVAVIVMLIFYHAGKDTVSLSLGGPDTFGQFGDYIGGVLNPIFGFLTICLLLEARKLNQQQATDASATLELSRTEYDRHQLETALDRVYEAHARVFDRRFSSPLTTYYGYVNSLKEAYESDLRHGHKENFSSDCQRLVQIAARKKLGDLNAIVGELADNAEQIAHLTIDLFKISYLPSLKVYWNERARNVLCECREAAVIDPSKFDSYISALGEAAGFDAKR